MIKINGIQKFNEYPFEFVLDGTEQFNKGMIKLNNITQTKPFDDYSDVLITINGVDYKFIQETDITNRVSKGATAHNITLQEEITKLNDVQVSDRVFTTTQGVQTTWLYHIQTQIETHDLEYTLDSATQTLLNVTATNQFYSGSFLDMLVTAFRAVDAIPTLNGTVIGHNPLNKLGNKIPDEIVTLIENDEINARKHEANINDYASSVYMKIKNGAYEEIEDIGATWFPSKTGYVSVRSTDNKYDDDQAQIQFNNRIRRIAKAYWRLGVTNPVRTFKGTFGSTGDVPSTATTGDNYQCDTNGYVSVNAGLTFDSGDVAVWVYDRWFKNISTSDTVFIDADVTPYILVKEAWDKTFISSSSSQLLNGIYQNNTFWYNDGGDVLNNMGTRYDLSFFNKDDALTSMGESFCNITPNIDFVTSGANSIRNTQYRFKIIALRDYETNIERHTTERVKLKSTKIKQQQNSRLELGKNGKASYQYVNRLGNDRFEITVQYYESNPYGFSDRLTYDDILGLFDYYNKYKIVKMKFMVYQNTIRVTYSFVENQSNLNPNTSFTNPLSPYTIQDNFEALTCYVKKHYVVFGSTLTDNTLNGTTKLKLWNRFDYSVNSDTPIYSAVYQSVDSDNNICLDVQRKVEGSGLSFTTQFNSKTIAGFKIESTGFVNLAHKNTSINYTNDFGEVEECKFIYCNDVNVTPDNFPIANSYTPTFGDYTRTVKLQPNEILGETTRIECITDRENLLIYEAYLKHNSLIREIGEEIGLIRVYFYSNQIFTTDTKEFPTNHVAFANVVTGTYQLSFTAPTTGLSWCIVDDITKEIYFAYNNYGEELTTINMSLRETNPNLGGIV